MFPSSGEVASVKQAAEIAGAQQRAGAARESGTRVRLRRRRFSDALFHAPQTLRALVRTDELWLVALAAFVGFGAGLVVVAMNTVMQAMHQVLFGLHAGERLSAVTTLSPVRMILVPTLGGLCFGLLGLLIARQWPRRSVDPIEANALHGGRMSLTESLIVVIQTIFSSGVGASVGLEAGYTQMGSAIGSRLGRFFRVRRNDLRLLVGCGAAGAIGAAFNAPLTGAFYAFELIIGNYTLAMLAPVVVASIVAIAVTRALLGDIGGFQVELPNVIRPIDYLPLVALGMLCALFGIVVMRGVTLAENAFRKTGIPVWLRPAVGGLIVGLLGLEAPQVFSSGHGALHVGIDIAYPLKQLAVMLLFKAIASAVSVGAGFRGGLFFASLFLGAMLGKLFFGGLDLIAAADTPPMIVCALVGMGSMATAIVGGPLTMALLALESTGSLSLTIAVLAASVVSAMTVRRIFGYSFATWRFHLRGEAIRSAIDIGWMRNLTVGRMMRRDVRTVHADMSVAAFRRDFPLGATQRVVVVDRAGRYAGIVLVPEAHAVECTANRVSELLHYQNVMLFPQMNVKEAIAVFENAEADALAVVDNPESRRVLGILTEQYLLRRYAEELDQRRRELSGE
ncbi:MAG: chloride channel protein [Acetobacteraceae bacterium]|nr:chloride channel protein [Acetobacteraceae bacterium]